jgi:hypothetical protein
LYLDTALKIILKLILQKKFGDGVNCIHVALDKDQWQVLADMVVNLQVPQNALSF